MRDNQKHNYDAREAESVVLPEPGTGEEYEDEDELDRIPLEEEPTLQGVMTELPQGREGFRQQTVTSVGDKAGQNKSGNDNRNKSCGLGVTAMILGILSILGFCIPVIGLVLAAVAVVLGIVAAARNHGRKMGTSGIIMGSIVLLSYLVIFIFFDGAWGSIRKNQDRLTDTAWRRTTDGSVLYLYNDGTFIDVEQEGVFSDNFYSGTYDILAYEDTGLHFTGLEGQYNTNYVYDVYLYVNTYVSNGEEREDIAGTIRYLYLFERSYETGDAVDVCAHDSMQYGTVYPVKETNLAYPAIGNQYVAGIEAGEADTEGIPETVSGDTTEDTVENTTEGTAEGTAENTTENAAENVTGAATDAPPTEPEEPAGAQSPDTTASSDLWGSVDDFMDDPRDGFEDFASSVSEEMDKNSESMSSAMEEASSAMEEMEEIVDVTGIQKFFQNIRQWLQDIFSGWGW